MFIGKNIGVDILSPDDKKLLNKYGIKIDDFGKQMTSYERQFYFGKLSVALGDKNSKKLGYNDFLKYIRRGQYQPLNQREKDTLQLAKQRTYTHLKALETRVVQTTSGIISQNSIKFREQFEKVAKKSIERAILERDTIASVVSEIGEKTKDYNRDLGRIAATEMQTVYEEGRSMEIEHKHGKEAYVYKDVFPQACRYCISFYTTGGIGTKPKVFKLDELRANGTNVGRKQADWLPTIPPVHPFCFDDKVEVLTNEGWKFFKDLNKKETFLSVDLDTGEGSYVRAINWIEEFYEGELIHFFNKNNNITFTPNHYHVINTYSNKKYRLISTDQLPVESNFLTHLPQWKGLNVDNIVFDNITFLIEDFVRFMGYYISEGSLIYYNTWKISISQSEKKYYEDIFQTCSRLFNSVNRCKGYIQINLKKDQQELIQYLQLGKSFEKYIPNNIKQLKKELLEVFLNAYCNGDGSIYKGRKWDGYQCNNYRLYYTSSKRICDDLSELIIKIGKRPSYKFVPPKSIFDPKRNQSYTQNYGIYKISELSNKHAYFPSFKREKVPYSGYVYDVELEKFHTLIVRREGKMMVSGNCRCLLQEIPSGYVWDDDKKMFVAPAIDKNKPKYGIKISVGDKEFKV